MTKTKITPEISPDNRFMSFSRIFISAIMLIFMGILTASSLLGTTGMKIIFAEDAKNTSLFHYLEIWESIIYSSDNVVMNVIWLILCVLICYFMMPLLKKIPIWAELSAVAVWTIVLGGIWVYSSNSMPTQDSWFVTAAALDFASDKYDFLKDNYFLNYSYQLGYVFFNEIFIRAAMLFGEVKNLLFLEMINVILLAASYIGVILINSLIFKDQRVRHITAFLMMFAAQPIIFCSFLYGIIPGITFAIYSVLFMVLYFRKNKFIFAVLSALFLAASVMIKSNNLIVLVAVSAISFFLMFKRKKFIRDISYILIAVILSVSVSPAVKAMYEKRGDTEMRASVPYSTWFVLGLNEAENGPGWYNPYFTLYLFEQNNFDPDATSKEAVKQIKERIRYFAKNPEYCNEFFNKKFLSQWNETSYQSIWNNQVRENYAPRKGIAKWVCEKGEMPVKRYMDIYAQLIFVACFAGLIACLKNKNFLSVTFPLIILGGMLYHLLAEAKSQYAIPYFILMIGFAGYGICVIYDFLDKKADEFFHKKKNEADNNFKIEAEITSEAVAENISGNEAENPSGNEVEITSENEAEPQVD